MEHPRERFLTVYGRKAVLEALRNTAVEIDKVVVARHLRGDAVGEIEAAAAERGLRVDRATADKVSRLSGDARHDQGVVADVVASNVHHLDDWLEAGGHDGARLFVLDGVTNPSNVGMIIRTAVAAGMSAVVLPRAGVPDVGPLVVKASAGVAFAATILRAETALDSCRTLRRAGVRIVALTGAARLTLYDAELSPPVALVLGNETDGVSRELEESADERVSIPLAGGVESLNVATAAAVVAFELARRLR